MTQKHGELVSYVDRRPDKSEETSATVTHGAVQHVVPERTVFTDPGTGLKKFCCTWPGCGHVFTRKQHLEDHVNLHRRIKPYPCQDPECSYRGTSKNNVRRHMKTSHPGLQSAWSLTTHDHSCWLTPYVWRSANLYNKLVSIIKTHALWEESLVKI